MKRGNAVLVDNEVFIAKRSISGLSQTSLTEYKRTFEDELFIRLQAGDVLTCSSNRWLGKAIQWFTKSKFNHSALLVEIWGQFYVSDSQARGTNPILLKEWIKKYNYNYQIHRPIKYPETKLFLRAASRWGRTPYDFKSLLWWFPLYVLTKKWRGKKGDDATKAMYCSEYVSWVYRFDEWWRMSPQDLFDKLEESNDFKRL